MEKGEQHLLLVRRPIPVVTYVGASPVAELLLCDMYLMLTNIQNGVCTYVSEWTYSGGWVECATAGYFCASGCYLLMTLRVTVPQSVCLPVHCSFIAGCPS